MTLDSSTRVSAGMLLLPSIATALLGVIMMSSGLYFGSPYWLWDVIPRIADSIILCLFLSVPIAIFSLFLIWPVTIAAADLCERLDPQARWRTWLAVGALLGVPLMWLYSLLLGLGFELYLSLSINGAFLGLVCSALSRFSQSGRFKVSDVGCGELE